MPEGDIGNLEAPQITLSSIDNMLTDINAANHETRLARNSDISSRLSRLMDKDFFPQKSNKSVDAQYARLYNIYGDTAPVIDEEQAQDNLFIWKKITAVRQKIKVLNVLAFDLGAIYQKMTHLIEDCREVGPEEMEFFSLCVSGAKVRVQKVLESSMPAVKPKEIGKISKYTRIVVGEGESIKLAAARRAMVLDGQKKFQQLYVEALYKYFRHQYTQALDGKGKIESGDRERLLETINEHILVSHIDQFKDTYKKVKALMRTIRGGPVKFFAQLVNLAE